MHDTDLQNVLDGLDRRMALGEIDLGTYQSLKAKFSERASTTADPLQSAVSQMAREAKALKCPSCMAPLPLQQGDGATVLHCEYCGGTFALQTAADEMERLRADIRKWVSDLAGGGSYGGMIDEASRRYIFKDKLLPSLRLAADRATETFSLARHGALFSFPLANDLPSSPFLLALQGTPDSAYLVERIKLTEARADSAEMLAFAVTDDDRASLTMLQVQCQESIRLSGARRHLMRFEPDGFSKSLANLQALRELYGKVVTASGSNAGRAAFAKGLVRRIAAVTTATEQLGYLLRDSDGVMTDPVIAALERVAAECAASAVDIERSGVEPREQVPAAEGARVDAQSIRILGDCVKLFAECGAENGHSFRDFMTSLGTLMARAREASSGLEWLGGFLNRLTLHVAAQRGEPVVAKVADFSDCQAQAAGSIQSSLFGGKETATVASSLAIPFWVAELSFSQQTGIIFKKGHATQELLLVDASQHGGSWCRAAVDSNLGKQTLGAIAAHSSLNQSSANLIPVMSADKCLAALKAVVQTTPGYAGGEPRIIGMVYLPGLRVQFASKKTTRYGSFVTGGVAQAASREPTRVALGTISLFIA